ncbi:MAG: hypothetical protein PHC51_02050 [bacterium]|nr:hypothetical protein [bacterium]
MNTFDDRVKPPRTETKEALSMPQAPGVGIEVAASDLKPGLNKFNRNVTIQGTPAEGAEIIAPNVAINNDKQIQNCSITASSGGRFKIAGTTVDVSPVASGEILISGNIADSKITGAQIKGNNFSNCEITAAELKANNLTSGSSVIAAKVQANAIDSDCEVIAHKISTKQNSERRDA